MKRDILVESTRLEMIQLCHSALDSRTLRIELLHHLQKVVPFSYAYFSTTDPATQFCTSSVLAENPPSWFMALFLENEFMQTDFNKFSDMLRNHQKVSILSEATRHELHQSQRYREMLAPIKMEDELRVVFASDAACWGILCLHREQITARYSPIEAAFVAQLAPHIAEGLRKALLLDNLPLAQTPDGPGVLLLAEDLSIITMTAAAEYWLLELMDSEMGVKSPLPPAVRSVVAGLQALECGLVNSTPKVRLRTRLGHWLVLYASRLRQSQSQAHITVIFEIAQPTEIAPLIMQAYHLTRREREIAQCVVSGWSTTEIAAKLHISSHTVQDHLKAIFEKVDVGSRGE